MVITIFATTTHYGVAVPVMSKRLDNIYENGELIAQSTVSKMEIVQQEIYKGSLRSLQRAFCGKNINPSFSDTPAHTHLDQKRRMNTQEISGDAVERFSDQ